MPATTKKKWMTPGASKLKMRCGICNTICEASFTDRKSRSFFLCRVVDCGEAWMIHKDIGAMRYVDDGETH